MQDNLVGAHQECAAPASPVPEKLQIGTRISESLCHPEIQISKCQCQPGRDSQFREMDARLYMRQLQFG